MAFEDEVRRVAEAVWSLEPGECQPEWYKNDPVLHELDGIVRLRDITHLIMATTSRKLDKTKGDVLKLDVAAKKEQRRDVAVEKWLITEFQLEAEHLEYARKSGVKALTLAHFRNRFFDGRTYISKRRVAAFGSARNLENGSITIPEDEYIELPMTVVGLAGSGKRGDAIEKPTTLESVVALLKDGKTVVIVGPFGAGKSLTTRELFLRLAKEHLRDSVEQVPLALNLREHWGALYGDEILERHARSIGFSPRENLTIAWRAGIATLLLDGFDELASQAIAKRSERNFMRQARYEALQAVRDLVGKVSAGSGLLLCGRDHYFDDLAEMEHSLGVNRSFILVKLGEFTEAQASEFLRRRAKTTILPDWLPRKPLILGYLAHQHLLDEVLRIDASRGFGYAWDSFLDLVCKREAEHERAVMDPNTVRHVLERVACFVRGTTAGNGPITGIDLAEAYRAETGDVAGEGVLMQLQRLPGLTPREQDPAARSFVDPDMLAALQGSAVARTIIENASNIVDRRWLSGLTRDGVRMAMHILTVKGFTLATVLVIAARLVRNGRPEEQQLAADCFSVALELGRESGTLDTHGLMLSDVSFGTLDLEDLVLDNVRIVDSAIDTINVGVPLRESSVVFERCIFAEVNGAQSEQGLPAERFRHCEFRTFDDASTNAAVLRLGIPDALKVLMTILRKLYLQAGGGRKIAALRRGLPGGQISDYVEPVLAILGSEEMISLTDGVVHPIRRHTDRVRRILAAGALSDDPLVNKVSRL